MLQNYGYIFEKNSEKIEVVLKFELNKDTPHYDLKKEIIGHDISLLMWLNDNLNDALSKLRIALYEGDELLLQE